MKQDYVIIEGVYKAQTRKAALFVVDGVEYWIPRSNLGYRTEEALGTLEPNDIHDIRVAEWFAQQKINY